MGHDAFRHGRQPHNTGVPDKKSEALGREARKGEVAKTREIKLGCVFSRHGLETQGNSLRAEASTTYEASFQPAADFGMRLFREAFAREMAAAAEVVFIGDGATWVWELAYPRKNRDRMLYATFRSRCNFIGSGVVEAGCKTLVGKRLKNHGMLRSLPGTQNVVTLQTA